MVEDAARLTRVPDAMERFDLILAIAEALKASGKEQQVLGQEAVDMAVQLFGIDLTNVTGGRIIFNPNLSEPGQTDGETCIVQVGPLAFKSHQELVVTIVHEVTHANQAGLRGDAHELSQRRFAYEVMAYSTAQRYEKEIQVGTDLLADNLNLKERFLNLLTPENRAKLLADGKYWEFDPTEDKTLDPALVEELRLLPQAASSAGGNSGS